MKTGRLRLTVTVTLAFAMILCTSGCSGGAANMTCKEFIKLSPVEMDEAVRAWQKATNNTPLTKSFEQMQLQEHRQALIQYCSNSTHAKDRLRGLDYTWGYR